MDVTNLLLLPCVSVFSSLLVLQIFITVFSIELDKQVNLFFN